MPDRAVNMTNIEEPSPGRIQFLMAPLSITRSKKGKIKLAVREEDFQLPIEEEFQPLDEHVNGFNLAAGTQGA